MELAGVLIMQRCLIPVACYSETLETLFYFVSNSVETGSELFASPELKKKKIKEKSIELKLSVV